MEFNFKCINNNNIMTIGDNVKCAGPILDFCIPNNSYTEYYLHKYDYNNNEIKEDDLIKWVNFINVTGLNIIYCGIIYKYDIKEYFYLCIIHNSLILKNFPNLKENICYLNLMSVQALRYIEYYPELIDFAYLIHKEIQDVFLSIQISHYKYATVHNLYYENTLDNIFIWICFNYPILLKSNYEFNNIYNINSINSLFINNELNNKLNFNYLIKKYFLTNNNKLFYMKKSKKAIYYLINNEFKNFIIIINDINNNEKNRNSRMENR